MSRPRRLFIAVTLLFAAARVMAPASCAAQTLPSDQSGQPRIVNGLTTHAYPSTGALLYHPAGSPGSASLICSGTLIGCNTFLTASHCVVDDNDPAHYFVFLQHAGISTVSSVVPHPDYQSATFPLSDVAVVHLSSTVTGIDPTQVNATNPTPYIPHAGTIVGFGQTLGNAGDYGIKRYGAIQTESCNPLYVPQGGTNTEEVCWSYATPVGAPGTDSNTCNGDSGGPLLMDFGSGEAVAGVTSGGTNGTCNTTDHSYDANVYTYRSFIIGGLGGDSTAACGPIPPVGDAATTVIGKDGALGTSNSSDSYTVNLSSQANVVRFVLNAEDNGALDADLYVRRGAPATTTSYDCKADGAGNFGACEVELPATGSWYVLVQRASGAGDYQLTTTVFGGAVPVCGNAFRETGEQCDGADDANCPGLCNNLTCQCPTPVCGNGVTESGEACDGASVAGCLSGVCNSDCTCAPACGDDRCDPGETVMGCPQDCGCAAAGACPYGAAPAGCYCDLACSSFGDCCPDACTVCDVCAAGCGNGIVEFGEECDDGNNVAGDCCSPTCVMDAPGSPCDDGSLCTKSEQCDAAARCVGQPDVATGCFVAERSMLKIDDSAASSRDRLKWTWLHGEAVDTADLGNPLSTTAYDLCVFDFDGGQPKLAVSAHVGPGPGWIERPGRGWNYSDPAALADGVQKLALVSGTSAKVKLKARGAELHLPGPVASVYFRKDPSIITQLRNNAGTCWVSNISRSTVSTAGRFVGKSP